MVGANSTLLIGPLSERPDGLSMAFKVVVQGFVNQGLDHNVVNTKSEDTVRRVGSFSFRRTIEITKVLLEYSWKLLSAQRIYLLIGLSRVSFLRDFLIIWSACLLKRRIVLHVHSGGYRSFYDSQPSWAQRVIMATLMCANALIILSELLREQFDFLPNADEKLYVVPNCAPFEVTRENVGQKELQKSEPIKLLYLSNFIETKGYLDCLEACRILHHDKNIPVFFSFCGGVIPHKFGSRYKTEQEILDHFFAQVQQMELESVVAYLGTVTGQEKEDVFINSHVLVLPTYYAWEGQPISIIEALAFGMPVIATRFRGIPEQVIDNYNGFLISARNPIEIANKVERMWNEPDLYRQLSANAIQHFRKTFTQEKHLARLIPIILGA